MLGRPEQWQCFMKWLWDYGNDRLIHQAAIEARRKGTIMFHDTRAHNSR